jgi:hypothetical protein
MPIILYFDNCVWNRNFDAQNNDKIKQQRRDINSLLELRKRGILRIASSDAVEAELMLLLDKNREIEKQEIMQFVDRNSDLRLPTAYNILGDSKWARLGLMRLAKEGTREKVDAISKLGFDHDDAVHIFTAVDNMIQYFVTVDERLIKKRKRIDVINIIAPEEALAKFDLRIRKSPS